MIIEVYLVYSQFDGIKNVKGIYEDYDMAVKELFKIKDDYVKQLKERLIEFTTLFQKELEEIKYGNFDCLTSSPGVTVPIEWKLHQRSNVILRDIQKIQAFESLPNHKDWLENKHIKRWCPYIIKKQVK